MPYARGLTQSAKAGGVAGEERALNDIATEVVAGMEPGALYILGPGTTTRTVMERLGLPKTLLGVDAVRDGALAGADLTEAELLALVAARAGGVHRRHRHRRPGAHLRAGQPADQPRRHPPRSAPTTSVIATQTKLLSLEGRPLLVDTGDPALDAELAGYVKVVTALGERTMYKVGA